MLVIYWSKSGLETRDLCGKEHYLIRIQVTGITDKNRQRIKNISFRSIQNHANKEMFDTFGRY